MEPIIFEIDNKITWYGSICLLSFCYSEETIMRLKSCSNAIELIENINMGGFSFAGATD